MAKKSESYEICFVPDNNYRNFLKKNVQDLEQKVAGGDFVLKDGTVVGKHKGYPFYTIGQRKGLELAFGHPMYVTDINAETNTVTIGEEGELNRMRMEVGQMNYIKYAAFQKDMEAKVKIRYKDSGEMAVVNEIEGGVDVVFHHNVKGVAPGQSAVFYERGDVIAGGIITKSYL